MCFFYALTRRFWGPISRFDHHRGNPALIDYKARRCKPCLDAQRGICYVGLTLSSCLVEVFGDTPEAANITDDYWFAILTPKTDLMLLDLRDNGAMRVGANDASLAKTHRRIISQAWSRLFYDYREIYHEIYGIIYQNAHNNEEAIAFYEPAANFLTCDSEDVKPLTDKKLRRYINKAAKDNNINVIFPDWLQLTTTGVA